MARKSRLVQALTLTEDILLFFDDYFKSTSWVQSHCGLPKTKVEKSCWYLVENKILNDDFTLKQKPKTTFREITKPWDKYWRLVIYDVPENKRHLRDKLRSQIYDLGFRQLQRSVWLSPFSATWLVSKIEHLINDPENFFQFNSQLTKKESNYLVDKLWSIEDWDYATRNFISELKKKGKVDIEDQKQFWNLLSDHPRVPLDLLPHNWPLKKLTKTFKKFTQ
jgi:DNA-binding transcriptional regulator PaaX